MRLQSLTPSFVLSSLGLRGRCLHHLAHGNNPTKTIGWSPTHKAPKQKVLSLQPSLPSLDWQPSWDTLEEWRITPAWHLATSERQGETL